MFNKKKKDNPQVIIEQKKKAVQDWLNIADINNGLIIRKDKYLVGAIKIEPINIDLLSLNEKKRIITALHEAYNGLLIPIQIICLGRPVDLDPYLESLQEMSRKTDNFTRKKLLQNYVKYSANLAASGETLERNFYILMAQPPGKGADLELLGKLQELSTMLNGAGLETIICNDQDLINLQYTFAFPVQAAYERAPLFKNPLATYFEL